MASLMLYLIYLDFDSNIYPRVVSNVLSFSTRIGVWRSIWSGSMLQSVGQAWWSICKCRKKTPIRGDVLLYVIALCAGSFNDSFFFFWFLPAPKPSSSPHKARECLPLDSHSQEQVKVCFHVPWSNFQFNATSCVGGRESQNWQDLSCWIYGWLFYCMQNVIYLVFSLNLHI